MTRTVPSNTEREFDAFISGKVVLRDNSEVPGVLGDPALCDGQKEITVFGGWRAYLKKQSLSVP